ncbi:hypothetical protein [Pontibacter qinzhouensis]|uniref:hypothetical protein n=1 Tax=Pontibacter qinzhouensis TaxID=2603253 RepID=UPI00164FFA7B|nr:hypothetical protein [Pontibacter qinzhouensis]
MYSLSDEFLSVMIAYSSLFSKPVFTYARRLLAGAILALGKRTVTSVLRVLGVIPQVPPNAEHCPLVSPGGGRIQRKAVLSLL